MLQVVSTVIVLMTAMMLIFVVPVGVGVVWTERSRFLLFKMLPATAVKKVCAHAELSYSKALVKKTRKSVSANTEGGHISDGGSDTEDDFDHVLSCD